MEDVAKTPKEDLDRQKQQQCVLRGVLEALKQASHQLHTHPIPRSSDSTSPIIKALLELETQSHSILSTDPHLFALSHLLSNLKTLIHTFHNSGSRPLSLRSFLTRRLSSHEISRLAASIESEIQAWIDREMVESLSKSLHKYLSCSSSSSYSNENECDKQEEPALIDALDQFQILLSQGFNRDLQDLILKSRVFKLLESIVSGVNISKKVRESAAFAIAELMKFNKDVFVGQVLMGQTIRALISLGSLTSLEVLCLLIKFIKSPLVDELESSGGISKIISFLNREEDVPLSIMAFHCVLEIGYFGRKEAVEAMMNAGLIKKLVELQRGELGGDLIDVGNNSSEAEEEGKENNRGVNVGGCEKSNGSGNGEMRYLERHPFASCVTRFAVQLEAGEGLRQREKRAFKQEALKSVREACPSDAEAAAIIAEVLWGSSP